MFKKKKANPAPQATSAPEAGSAEASQPAKKFPSLPISDSAAAGLIAVIFATVGVLLCVKTCRAANPKEKKPKKSKTKTKK